MSSKKWLEKIDKQGQKCGTWAVKEDLDFARCKWCNCKFKYSGSGGCKLIEHSSFDKHQENFNLSQSNLVLASNSLPSPSPSTSNQQATASPSLMLDNKNSQGKVCRGKISLQSRRVRLLLEIL